MNPYKNLADKAFWRLSVSGKNMLDIDDLWNPKFDIRQVQPIVTFGSCFAQHIGNALKACQYNWLMTEQPPYGLSERNAKLFGYNTFSARTGNIYSTSLLRQWTQWALDKSTVPSELWEQDGRFFDPFRPTIEPNGFSTENEMKSSRAQTISAFRTCITRAQYFVFTLGLTESWSNQEEGYEYPMCPGTAAGEFDPQRHIFKNQQFEEIRLNLMSAIELMREINTNLRFILTVSPVPLVATKSDNHVLVATMESKSILRAVAGQLATNREFIDYFPSYEIINSPVFRGMFYEPNQRSVNHNGVNFVMNTFFNCLTKKFGETKAVPSQQLNKSQMDAACDEELLDAFGGSVD